VRRWRKRWFGTTALDIQLRYFLPHLLHPCFLHVVLNLFRLPIIWLIHRVCPQTWDSLAQLLNLDLQVLILILQIIHFLLQIFISWLVLILYAPDFFYRRFGRSLKLWGVLDLSVRLLISRMLLTNCCPWSLILLRLYLFYLLCLVEWLNLLWRICAAKWMLFGVGWPFNLDAFFHCKMDVSFILLKRFLIAIITFLFRLRLLKHVRYVIIRQFGLLKILHL